MSNKIIYGDTVGTPMPRSDWAENNEKSAAYIKNKPTEEIAKNTEARHTHDNQEVLDSITQEMLDGFGEDKGLTPEQAENLEENTKARHTHENKEVLDYIGMDYDGSFSMGGVKVLTTDNGVTKDELSEIEANHYTKDEIDSKGFITAEDLPDDTCVIDSTLSIEGVAADAKAVGDKFIEFEERIPTKTSQLENDSGFITIDDIPKSDGNIPIVPDSSGGLENPTLIDPTLSIEGAAADAKATGDRLTDIEYQAVTTGLAYLHKDLPVGEKIVTVSGDGTFGNNAYVVCGEDIIPRKTYNRNFPFNGITISRDDKTYHIEGTATADGTVVFTEEKNISKFEIDKNIIGKTFKVLTFSNQYTEGKLTFYIQFFDSNNTVVQVLKSNGSSANYISSYMGNTTGYRETIFSIPENVEIKYAQAYISFKSSYTFNHDFQFYVVEADNTQTVTLDNPTVTITDENVTNVFSVPYESTASIKAPITDYIKYMTTNAKGDTATYLTPEAFGAIGDGYADDINAITACLAMANTTKQTVIMAKKYLISAPIDINGNDFNIYINDIVYNGADTAVKIHGQQNTIKIHSITSSGIGVKFLGDRTAVSEWTLYNDLEINTITAVSHGIIFESTPTSIYQNNVRFNHIKAGGDGCYGIAYFVGDGTYITENNFYGGHIQNCDWACYSVAGNSRLMNIEVEGNVKGGFYITGYVNIVNPRWAESSRDGEYPFLKFACLNENNHYITVDNNVALSISDIDLTDNSDFTSNAMPTTETQLAILNFPIAHRRFGTNNINTSSSYTHRAYVWGKYLIMTPFMAYQKEVTTEILDTRLIGQEETEAEIRAMSQLPTKFIVNNINTDIYLHESYCAFGFNEFEVEQANGFTCKVYDKLNNLIFDGTNKDNGLYKFKVYKDATHCSNTTGALRVDFLGHYWNVTKETTVNDVLAALPTWSGGVY